MRNDIFDLNADRDVEEIDRICDAFEAEWQNAKTPDLASFLEQLSDSRLRAKLFSELLMLELAYRSMKGNTVAWSEYEQQFPNFLQQIEVVAKQVEIANTSSQPAASRDAGDHLETADFVPQSLVDTDHLLHASASTDRDPTGLPEFAATGGLKSIGGFRLLGVLGEGGFGTVYRAEDVQLRRKVAIKLLRPRALALPDAKERFIAEARALAAIHHDHVVPIFSVGSEAGQVFIALPLLAGETLAARIDREGALPPEEVRRIGRETAEGLAAIHAKGLVHRDLKPANIWLEVGTGRVKVLDLGLAQDPLTPLNELSGTPAYMSPEQARGERLDGRADLFSLGAVLYECATGRRAHSGHTPATVLRSVCDETPTPVQILNPGVPSDIAQIISVLLSKDPSQRPGSAREVAAALETAIGPDESAKHPSTSRSWRWVALTITAVVVVGSIAALGYLPQSDTPKQPLPLSGSIHPPPKVSPLNILTFEVHHFASEGNKVRPQGILGQQSFGAALGDEFNVQAKLSRPAYSFLIVYRADGLDGVLYPQDDTDIPELTDSPHYPSKRRDERFVLEEGAGQWVVALLTSDTPLPSYREWRALHHRECPWTSTTRGKHGTVVLDDGQWIQQLEPGSSGTRGSKANSLLAPIARLTDWLRAQTDGSVQAVGFAVK